MHDQPSPIDPSVLGLSVQHLVKLAEWKMPFGKYSGYRLIDLPEEYLFWFERREFPAGELGRLLQLCLALKIEGLDSLVKPLKSGNRRDPEADNDSSNKNTE